MSEEKNIDFFDLNKRAVSQPLVTDNYTADPSAHFFDNKIYIYPSHDIDAGIPFNDNGDHFGMKDYHVYSMNNPDDNVAKDLGKILDIKDVPWAKRQMWAPDIAKKNNKFYLNKACSLHFQSSLKNLFLNLYFLKTVVFWFLR